VDSEIVDTIFCIKQISEEYEMLNEHLGPLKKKCILSMIPVLCVRSPTTKTKQGN